MSPHDSATATATKTDAIYDDLSQDEQDAWDAIAFQGWTPEPAGRGWAATKGEQRVGPCPTLPELLIEVTPEGDTEAIADSFPSSEVENDATLSIQDDGFELTNETPEPTGKTVKIPKQSLLPGTENAVLQDLRNAILSYRATTMEILDAQSRQKDEKKLVMALMHKFEDELSVDKETGFKFYQVETVRATLEVVKKEELKTEKVDLP